MLIYRPSGAVDMSATSCIPQLDHQTCRGSSIGRACGSYHLMIHPTSRSRVLQVCPGDKKKLIFCTISIFGRIWKPAKIFVDRHRKGFVPRFDFCPFLCFSLSHVFLSMSCIKLLPHMSERSTCMSCSKCRRMIRSNVFDQINLCQRRGHDPQPQP
jgi:hypothetical protein